MNYYYHPNPNTVQILNLEESAHIVKVLRAKNGDEFHLLDGQGKSYLAEITDANHRKCSFKIISEEYQKKKPFHIHAAIAPTKNMDRLEWFVEKACELGADQISIIGTKRAERSRVKLERLEKKAINAMKQSKNFWKCKINDIIKLKEFLKIESSTDNKFVAFIETEKEDLLQDKISPNSSVLVLIGPEGDFTDDEIELTKSSGFVPVSLGSSVLRTETAGIVAVHTVNLVNQF